MIVHFNGHISRRSPVDSSDSSGSVWPLYSDLGPRRIHKVSRTFLMISELQAEWPSGIFNSDFPGFLLAAGTMQQFGGNL